MDPSITQTITMFSRIFHNSVLPKQLALAKKPCCEGKK